MVWALLSAFLVIVVTVNIKVKLKCLTNLTENQKKITATSDGILHRLVVLEWTVVTHVFIYCMVDHLFDVSLL